MFRHVTAAAACLLTTCSALQAQDRTVGDLTIHDPVIVKSFAGARSAGGYMAITNQGHQPEHLVGIRVEGPMAMIHESREEDGVMRMIHVDAVEIPAGETVTFRPGGLHVMIMGLKSDDLPLGGTLDAVLSFAREGDVAVTFEVVDRSESGHTN